MDGHNTYMKERVRLRKLFGLEPVRLARQKGRLRWFEQMELNMMLTGSKNWTSKDKFLVPCWGGHEKF